MFIYQMILYEANKSIFVEEDFEFKCLIVKLFRFAIDRRSQTLLANSVLRLMRLLLHATKTAFADVLFKQRI